MKVLAGTARRYWKNAKAVGDYIAVSAIIAAICALCFACVALYGAIFGAMAGGAYVAFKWVASLL